MSNRSQDRIGLQEIPDSDSRAYRVLLVAAANQRTSEIVSLLREAGASVAGVKRRLSFASNTFRPRDEIIVVHRDGTDRFPELLRGWRCNGLTSPVMMLTDADDVVLCLNSGADDSVNATVDPIELRSRLKALSRRVAPKRKSFDSSIEVDDLRIDMASQTVYRAGRMIPLSPREYHLLTFLALNRGKVVSREAILQSAFSGLRASANSNVVDVYIRYLRQKIDQDFEVKLILTRRGYGYMLKVDNG